MKGARPRVFMMDLWATVPYYTAYLSRALLAEGVDVMVGSISAAHAVTGIVVKSPIGMPDVRLLMIHGKLPHCSTLLLKGKNVVP